MTSPSPSPPEDEDHARAGPDIQANQEAAKQARMLDQPDPLDQRNNQIIDECENMKWDGGFYREIKGSRGREGTNERKTPSCFGRGWGGGTPLPPP